jgi:hypothetical protein
MKYVSVLTPPALVCAVFLIALVAFLRREMGGRRRSEDLPPEDNSEGDPVTAPGADWPAADQGTSGRPDSNRTTADNAE